MKLQELIRKYDVPVPRYTSYPTVPFWDTDTFSEEGWLSAVKRCFAETNETEGISLYIHLPFCESLCTYCACNTRITRNHTVERKYITALLAEWELYKKMFNGTPRIRELHLGGGTPTFFSPENLAMLLGELLKGTEVREDRTFSFEGHPNNTTREHLETLAGFGFDRVSFGVQDLDLKVQTAINRIQPLENLQRVVSWSRELGYQSISFDLVYGLPYQTGESVEKTVREVIALRPDRIAFYSYAHVPWIKPGQRGYEDADLPTDVVKRGLYETGRRLFREKGYIDIGMDHFSLPSDSLAVAHSAGILHRNFMGYTTNPTQLLIGLGTSSISDARYAYAQNLKKVEEYQEKVLAGSMAIFKGHLQTGEDLVVREAILDIACRGRVEVIRLMQFMNNEERERFKVMEQEGLIEQNAGFFHVTETGRAFVRNICSAIDKKLHAGETSTRRIFSRAI